MNLSDYNDVRRTKVMVYGPPKAGKTALVGSLAAQGFKLWWFDFENGVKTLMNPEVLAPELRKNVSLFNIPDYRAMPIAIDVLRRLFKGGSHRFCYEHGVASCPICAKSTTAKWSEQIDLAKFGDHDILVLDSWSQVASSAINKVTLKSWNADPEYKCTFNDFGMQGMYLTEVLSKIQVANINICVISHEVDIEKDESKERIVPVGGTRNFSATIGKYFDEIVYAYVRNKKHGVASSTTWDNIHLTGGRSGVKMEDPTKPAQLVDIFRPRN